MAIIVKSKGCTYQFSLIFLKDFRVLHLTCDEVFFIGSIWFSSDSPVQTRKNCKEITVAKKVQSDLAKCKSLSIFENLHLARVACCR